MRILFISTLFPNSREPLRATFNRNLLMAMTKLGHEVTVVAPIITVPGLPSLRRSAFPPAEETIDGIEVYHPPFYRTPGCFLYWHHHFYRWSVQDLVRRLIAEKQIDHVMLGFAFPDAAAFAPLCQALKMSWSIRINGSDFLIRRKDPRLVDTLMTTLQASPRILCPGQALHGALIKAGLPQEKITWFNNGVDHAVFRPAGSRPEGKRVALFVGNFQPVKGVDNLIVAWNIVRQHAPDCEWELHLAGGGELRRSIEGAAIDPRSGGTIHILGRLSRTEVAEAMQKAHCLVLPSRSEGMPNVVNEALAIGIPVVGSDAGEMPWLIDDGVNGYIVKRDAADFNQRLANRLIAALQTDWDPTQSTSRVAEFTWESAASKVISAVEEDQGNMANV